MTTKITNLLSPLHIDKLSMFALDTQIYTVLYELEQFIDSGACNNTEVLSFVCAYEKAGTIAAANVC